ncbi:MAG: transglutaminase domain-containing protein [Candidatus Levybacteria bacterium]|nr:transglutaminase domain-containing protein [Candidatus Levybacteria bacterium]
MRKILFFVILALFLFFPKNIAAADNFSTDYNVSYNVSSNGRIHVTFKITLTNKTENYYASYYKIQLGVLDIENIKASDGQGAIAPDITKEADGTTVGLPLNQRVVGKGNKLTFDLSFDTRDIAQNLGRILEVNIPGLSNQDDFDSFSVNVLTPVQLGPPAYLKPALINAYSNNLTFNKDTLGKSGVYIAYGDYQVYSFSLTYHLYNKNLFPVKTEIALPPKTNYQDVAIGQISPPPTNVIVDSDGNWLAQYALAASERLDIKVVGKARVYLTPKKEELPGSLRSMYLRELPYWQSENAQIKKLAQELKTPQAIYNYVVKTLSYDFSRVTTNKPRLGAEKVLATPNSAVCLEFTDLFIAIARAAGIPAREVNGYAYTKNSRERPLSLVKDILHAWPQYWDSEKKTWVMIDPTWGNTTGGVDYLSTLDFDHFAFVIKGKDSSYPVSAGGYKLPGGEDKKDVLVEVDLDFEESLPVFKTDLIIKKSAFPWSPLSGTLVIKNEGSQISKPQVLTVDTQILSPKHQELSLEAIAPYGQTTIPLKFTTSSFLTKKQDQVKITIGQKSITVNVKIAPFNFTNAQLLAGGAAIVLFTIVISAVATKLWHLHLFKPQR